MYISFKNIKNKIGNFQLYKYPIIRYLSLMFINVVIIEKLLKIEEIKFPFSILLLRRTTKELLEKYNALYGIIRSCKKFFSCIVAYRIYK